MINICDLYLSWSFQKTRALNEIIDEQTLKMKSRNAVQLRWRMKPASLQPFCNSLQIQKNFLENRAKCSS